MQIYQRLQPNGHGRVYVCSTNWSRNGNSYETANAHPAVITIHPELLPFVFFRTTFATTRYLVKQGALYLLFLLQMVSYFCFRDKIILQPSFQRVQALFQFFSSLSTSFLAFPSKFGQ
jgi:hypothetical protein